MKRIKIGIVGLGNISTRAHLLAFSSLEDFEFIAGVDINKLLVIKPLKNGKLDIIIPITGISMISSA